LNHLSFMYVAFAFTLAAVYLVKEGKALERW